MAKYLQMDGVNDYIQVPSLTFTDIYIDAVLEQVAGKDSYYFDPRIGSSGYAYRTSTGTDSWEGYNIYVNGVSKSANTSAIPSNQRIMFRGNSAPILDDVTIFSRYSVANFMKGKIYSIKFYNGATLVAHYDMNMGTVQDQSGNGNHATLNGGAVWSEDTSIVFDTFSRANNATTLGNAETGQSWQAGNGSTWGIYNNTAYCASGTNPSYVFTETNQSDVDISLLASAVNDNSIIVFRIDPTVVDGTGRQGSFLALLNDGSLSKFNEGNSGDSVVIVPATGAFISGDTARIVANGPTITAYRNGTQIFTTTTPFNQTKTKHGFGSWRGGASGSAGEWDNFQVNSLGTQVASPIPTIVSIDKNTISHQTGQTQSKVTFTFDQDVTQWTVNVLGADQTTGTVADYGGTVTKGTQIQAVIDDIELVQEGGNRINIYGQNSTNQWTPYNQA